MCGTVGRLMQHTHTHTEMDTFVAMSKQR